MAKIGTKRALLMSVLSLMLCVTMLLGTTFAWFTDSVTSANNVIMSGNLDVNLQYWDMDAKKWKDVNGSSELFDENALWEPGYTHVVYLKVSNEGNLALKYNLGVNIVRETAGMTEENTAFYLSDYIYMDAVPGVNGEKNAYPDRAEAMKKATTDTLISVGYSKDGTLLGKAKNAAHTADTEQYVALIVHMPESVGNEAKHNGVKAPKIELGVTLYATQNTVEGDSFGPTYDAGAWLNQADYSWYDPSATTVTINTPAQLAGLAAIVNGTATSGVTTFAAENTVTKIQDSFAGKTVALGSDIDLNGMPWTPIGIGNGFKGTFDGNGHTVSNLVITGNKSYVGLFANTYEGEIKNLTVENAKVSGRLGVGVVAGNPYTSKFTNITVKGHIEVNGFAYVGGVGGRNAYANWENITVDADAASYVKAVSTEYDPTNANADENGNVSYRTYVGGVVGFNGEGSHTFTNITSNIDVIGDVCDIGGVFGIAHYYNKLENITCTGDVSSTGKADELGGIVGVWNNENGTTVTMYNCSFEGTVSDVNGSVSGCDIVGGKYSASGTGTLIMREYYEQDGVKYYEDLISGDIVLNGVTENAPAKLVVPEGVTILGNKILNGNTTVKEVVLPSTVKSFGGTPNATGKGASGGMFYNSAVEKVVLPEGLTEIPVAAFNQATKLTSVNIPSTVKKIGINAFAGTALTTLEVPATVEEIGYGAFREMISLTTVTIDGNVYIPGYAFRACKSLKNVYLNGIDVTFNNDDMIFTVTSTNNENPNGITVHVQNETVKARLEATGDFKGNIVCKNTNNENGYYNDDNGNAVVYSSLSLKNALKAGENVVIADDIKLGSNDVYDSNAYGATGININSKVDCVLDGNGNSYGISKWGTWDTAISITSGTIKNITVNSGMRGIFVNHNGVAGKVFLENVIIDGTVYTISCDQGTGSGLQAKNSTFNGWTSYAATLGAAEFIKCNFGEGQGYAYCRPYSSTTFTGCVFEEGYEIEPCANIILDGCYYGDTLITNENISSLGLIVSGMSNVTVK